MISASLRCLAVTLVAVLLSGSATAQDTAQDTAEGQKAAARQFVPPLSLVSIRLNAAKMFQSPSFEMLPFEVAQAWCLENLGLDLMSVSEIKLVVGMPMGPGTPPLGAVVRLAKDFDPSNISADLLVVPGIQQVGDHKVYILGNRESVFLHMVNDRTVLLAMPNMFEPMLVSADGEGPLADLIESNPMGDTLLQLIAVVEPARPMLVGAAQQVGQRLPEPIEELTRVPELLDALMLGWQEDESGKLSVAMETADPAKASELLAILNRSIAFGKDWVAAQSEREIRGEGPLADAQRAYAIRISEQIAKMLTPKQQGDRLVIDGEAGVSVASTGILVALLLPAVQASREAARRMQAANNLKQIGLAMHNYHAAYKELPLPASVDKEGKPLLSWRVAILPFIEQQALYDQFHLDEPWDSPHNKKLASVVVPVFTDPSVATQPGYTVFQAAVGDGLALVPEVKSSFRDFTDGTSNTILVVETDASEAVPWTAPDDVEIDLNDPLAKMGHSHPGGFQVLFGDGSVRFISHAIDVGLFRALLTRSGGEAVGGF